MAVSVSSNMQKGAGTIPYLTDDQDLKGGFRCVASIADRDAIAIGARRAGMLVRVVESGVVTDYVLSATDLTNTGWTLTQIGNGAPPTKVIADTAYTLSLADLNHMLEFTAATDVTVTIPLQTSVAWPADAWFHLTQAGTGKVSIVGADVAVTIAKPTSQQLSLAEEGAVATLMRRPSENAWRLYGLLTLV